MSAVRRFGVPCAGKQVIESLAQAFGELHVNALPMAEMAVLEPEEAESLKPDLERDLAALQGDWNRMEQLLLLGEPFDERGEIGRASCRERV